MQRLFYGASFLAFCNAGLLHVRQADLTSSVFPTGTSLPSESPGEVSSITPDILNSTNDPNKCHKDLSSSEGFIQNVFCKPADNSSYGYNTRILATWDPDLFANDSMISIELYSSEIFDNRTFQSLRDSGKSALFASNKTANSNGADFFTTTLAMTNTSSTSLGQEMILVLAVYPSSGGPAAHLIGPSIYVVDRNAAQTIKSDKTSPSNSHKLGQGIGISLGLIFLLGFCAGSLLFFRKRAHGNHVQRQGGHHRRSASSVGSFSQFMDKARSRIHGDTQAKQAQKECFQDEPTRGGHNAITSLELKHTDQKSFGGDHTNWGWPGVATSTDGHGNVFRQEVGRQQAERGW